MKRLMYRQKRMSPLTRARRLRYTFRAYGRIPAIPVTGLGQVDLVTETVMSAYSVQVRYSVC